MQSINERILYIVHIKSEGSLTKFSEILESTPQYVNKITKEGGSVGLDPITKILRAYPDIDARWLILGEGYPFIADSKITDLKKAISDKVSFLLNIEKYIPVMTPEQLDALGEFTQNGKDPEFTEEDLKLWDKALQENNKLISDKISDAMKRGVCKHRL